MFAQCKGPLWRWDDFSPCFQHDYLQALIPLIAVGVSIFVILIQTILYRIRSNKSRVVLDSTGEYVPVRGNRPAHAQLDGDETDDDTEDGADLVLEPAVSRGQHSTFAADKPKGLIFWPVVEELVVLAVLAIQIVALVFGVWGKHAKIAAAAGVVVWLYISALVTARLVFSSRLRHGATNIWYHTAWLYTAMWPVAALLFRSQIANPRSDLARALMIAHFALVTALTFIMLASRKGNVIVEVEYEGDLEPSHELTASVFSLATFSWLDPLIYKGYKRPLELIDVWNLIPQDKAAKVVADYRQVVKTSRLAVRLLGFFKGPLLLQGAYACASGVLTFGPTLLLKKILEYVEEPAVNSKSSAWFFVILLFVCGVVNAVFNGQALFIGRKVCIQLRAIIVGEIYAKALRRRTAVTAADKILGQSKSKTADNGEDKKKKGFFSRIFSKSKKSDKDDKKPDAKKDKPDEDEGQVSTGAIINLMSVDSFKVAEIAAYLHFLWGETPVQLVLSIWLLYALLGYSSIAGMVLMVILTPINYGLAKLYGWIQKRILAATDSRIHITNEVLTNIRIIKYFAWESRFIAQVDEKRATEITQLRNRFIIWAFGTTVWAGAPILITLFTFMVYTMVEHRPLIPSVAFTALSLFSILRVPLDQLADMIAHVQEAKVSVDRIEEYLNEAESAKYEQLKPDQLDEDGQHLIGFDSVTTSWGTDTSDDFKLFNLDLYFKVGELNVICGPTGSGKTSLLMALLGEMTVLSGQVYLPSAKAREDVRPDPKTGLTETVAYCAQQAWLVNGTIRENILFASKFDIKRYNDVINACSLKRDLEILDGGDQTLVGEKGVTLSGGQKQRISLARALYCRARHVLLDDVLSAVDAHTAKWIFEHALSGPLMKDRTCILVTHNVSLCIPRADFAVVLENGKVTTFGTPDQVIASGKLSEDLTKSRTASAVPSRVPSRAGSNSDLQATENTEIDGFEGIHPANPDHGGGNDLVKIASNNQAPAFGTETHAPAVDEEAKATGSVSMKTIFTYLTAMGGVPFWIVTVIGFVVQQVLSVGTNVWVREWANAYAARQEFTVNAVAVNNKSGLSYECIKTGACLWQLVSQKSPDVSAANVQVLGKPPMEPVNDGYYLAGYAVIAGGYMFLTFARNMWVFYGSIKASERIHRKLIECVMRAKFRFFDSTPLGQIMNRFSKDIELVDQEIAPVAYGVVHCLASIIAIIVLITAIIPQFLIAAFFISLIYVAIGTFYINSSRDLKRLESIQRSPLFQQFGETLSGMTTIRAYNDERRFIRDNLQKVNTHSRPFIFLWAANRWLAFRVDIAGALVAFVTGVFIIANTGRIDAGAAGLAMTYALTFNENVIWYVRLYAMNEQNMNAVERIQEYFNVEQEADAFVDSNRTPANWPSQGGVEFIGYSTRYRKEFDFVLKELTFKIAAGEKVGVVGRTGAGKSSLALALFRALEAEQGKILVDDVDIGLIGLQDLRENIVMVPQDPTLFSGTIRTNLDPFNLYTDEEIFEALRRVQLVGSHDNSAEPSQPGSPKLPSADQPTIVEPSGAASDAPSSSDETLALQENKNLFKNLSSNVAESGSNLSQGQRQLLCLARALLKAPKVLLMDEATASIDYATDAKIQETIREFKNTTLTIAHRLQTIIDYDKVLVLDKGEVIEYGDPYDLIRKEGGSFRSMCETSGDMDTLVKEAKKANLARKLVDDE